MPSAFDFETELNLIVLRCWGSLTLNELKTTFAEARNDVRFHIGMRELGDFSGVVSVDFGFAEMMGLADKFRQGYDRAPGIVKAAHYAPEDVAYGMSRMFETMMSDVENLDLGLYRTLDPALAHIGLSRGDMPERFALAGAA